VYVLVQRVLPCLRLWFVRVLLCPLMSVLQHRKWRARQDTDRTLKEATAAAPDIIFVQMVLCGLLRRRRCGEVLFDRFGFVAAASAL
jgi:hypothetical protein